MYEHRFMNQAHAKSQIVHSSNVKFGKMPSRIQCTFALFVDLSYHNFILNIHYRCKTPFCHSIIHHSLINHFRFCKHKFTISDSAIPSFCHLSLRHSANHKSIIRDSHIRQAVIHHPEFGKSFQELNTPVTSA